MAMTSMHSHRALPFGPSSSGRNRPSPPRLSSNFPLLWRLAAIALIPLIIWLATSILYERIPQSAGNLHYDVVINTLTGTACIEVKNEPMPAGLADLGC